MSTFRYYRVINPEKAPLRSTDSVGFSETSTIGEAEFTAAVGERQPDARAEARALVAESRRFPLGAVVYWRVSEATGGAEGWLATAPANG
jgi:hypothetical protein